jgi:hypothetical protein
MPPLPVAIPDAAVDLYNDYRAWLNRRGIAGRSYLSGARTFFARHPDPERWATLTLQVRLSEGNNVRPLLNFLMLFGHLHPGYDYLLERKLTPVLREIAHSPLAGEMSRFLQAAQQLGYSERARVGMASEVAARLLIQTGGPLVQLSEADIRCFEEALAERERHHGRPFVHYRSAPYTPRVPSCTILERLPSRGPNDGRPGAGASSAAFRAWALVFAAR